MSEGFVWPESLVLEDAPSQADLEALAEDALQAFFTVVCERLDEWYAPAKTWGDETPSEYGQRHEMALRWIEAHATNNAIVATANDEDAAEARPLAVWSVSGLEACEAGEIVGSHRSGVFVDVETLDGGGSAHCPRVTVSGPSREAVLDFVRGAWGDDEATGGWVSEYVVPRIVGPSVCEDCGREVEVMESGACDSCDQQRRYDEASAIDGRVVDTLDECGCIRFTDGSRWFCVEHGENVPRPKQGYGATMTPRTRVKFRHDVDRYPHFIVPAGALGTVVDVGDAQIFAVKMDEQVPGAEDWENECHWVPVNGDDPLDDLEVVGESAPVQPRTVLVHLNVEVPADDERNADEIGDLILGALEVGLEGAPGSLASDDELTTHGLTVSAPLVEEV